MSHIKWPSIESLKHVRISSEFSAHPAVCYRAKVKLHGTNAAIRHDLVSGEIIAQSRSQDLGVGNTNSGFFTWVDKNRDNLQAMIPPGMVVFGEWCGPGIMKGVAVNNIPEKSFCVFAAIDYTDPANGRVIYSPDNLESLLVRRNDLSGCYIIPYHGGRYVIDFALICGVSQGEDKAEEARERIRNELGSIVDEVESCDPYIKNTFDIEGIGEGVVMYPIYSPTHSSLCFDNLELFSHFIFKAKGEKHQVKSIKQKVEIDSEILATADAFADMFVTSQRLDQCLAELKITTCLPQYIGTVIKWMHTDIIKESAQEFAESGLEWKVIASVLSRRVREMFMSRS